MEQTQPSTSPGAKSMPIAKQNHINLNQVAFETWDHQTLIDFCYAAEAHMRTRDDQIQQLQCDLKDAINAYREVIKKQ